MDILRKYGHLPTGPAFGIVSLCEIPDDLSAQELVTTGARFLSRKSGVIGVRFKSVSDYYYRDLDDAHWARAQGALIDFLNADLDLAFTWLKTASIDVREDPKGYELALAKVRTALNAIRRIEGRIEDELARREIAARTVKLEAAIKGLENSK